ncbi:MAG: hypothetical protein V3U75_11065 [Methylococcaceae bacterium]
MITVNKSQQLSKLIFAIAVFSLPSISFSNPIPDEELIEQLESAHDTIQQLIDNQSSYSQTPLPKSREEFEPLKGTWTFNFNHNGTEFTSTVNLNEFAITDEGNEGIGGPLVINQGESERVIACVKLNATLIDDLGTDFLCTTPDAPFPIYSFRFSGDTITNGFFTIGDTIMEASVNIADPAKRSPVTGSRGSGEVVTPVVPPPTGSEAIYDDATEELTIPVVNYQGSKYRVILQNQGDFVFTIKEAEVTN